MSLLQGKTPQLMAVLREVLNHGADVRLAETRVRQGSRASRKPVSQYRVARRVRD